MHTKIFYAFFLFASICSCITPKEARQLKRETKSWRASSVVLEAYADSPFAGTFLTLRENKRFEHTSSGVVQSFEAGNWELNQDTIHLFYVNQNQKVTDEKNVFLDRQTSTLIFEGDTTPVYMRLKIISNKL